jgi:coproporphyrinogen III oxidase
MPLQAQRDNAVIFLKDLRDRIIQEFQALETEGQFVRKEWTYTKGQGGGEMSVLRGKVFEKAAVNWSGVMGSHFPGTNPAEQKEGHGFFATGVSLITHMRNPKMPTVHFNIRYIERGDQWWLGGGFDLTPMGFENPEDTQHFHKVAEQTVSAIAPELYPQWKENAREYFTIKHYNAERGVGGIFFDNFRTGNSQNDWALWKSVGDHFLEAIMPIYLRRIKETYTEEDKQKQLKYRARYVEFNLLYDRGTRFGFESGGNPEAILCSMPPLAAW